MASTKASTSKRKALSSSTNGSAKRNRRAAEDDDGDATLPLGKALASTEKRVRDGAVRSLSQFLAQNGAHALPDLEIQKLWKGLFYCFWMSDKPLIQQRLAQDLSNLVLVKPSTTATSRQASTSKDAPMSQRAQGGLKFLEGFWDVLVAEWAGLDKHRIDKFYLLIRRFVNAGFQLLALENWNLTAVKQFTAMFGKPGGALNTNDPRVPDSLTYHLSDVYLDELEKALELSADTHNQDVADEEEDESDENELGENDLPLVPTLELLSPFVNALATAKSKQMYERIWTNVFEPLLDDTLRASAREDLELDSEPELDDEDDDAENDEDDDDEDNDQDDDNAKPEGGDETINTEFHSFADERSLVAPGQYDDDSEPSLGDSDSDSDSDSQDGQDDIRYPLLLALSSVPLPTLTDDNEDEDVDEEMDVANLLRRSIFKALFSAASRKDATESRRRRLYELWRTEQDRLNDQDDKQQNDKDDDDDDEEDEEEDEEEKDE
ncbi:Nop52-domain-containing protein [Testicularia cyperi]|uniref:Nop52-domain-containing protein n=1 Tax=Testicularia cyperi TaxID=1882483 RepID=A0A317XLY2_9BASI|nr:Nop52-domain-containing protein [Testicularia cyperi]